MKKITFSVLVLFISTTASAVATPLIGSMGASGYEILDRSQVTDTWSIPYEGYFNSSDYTGYYLGTVDSVHDAETDLEALISYYLDSPYDITILEKVNSPDASSGDLSVSYNDPATSGTWSTALSDPAVAVNFYTVKSGTEYALYFVDPALQDGDWVTYHLLNNGGQIPLISHLSASLVPVNEVPEPRTMLLFGSGLFGLASMRMRKRKK